MAIPPFRQQIGSCHPTLRYTRWNINIALFIVGTRDVEAIDRFQLGGWDSNWYLNYKVEAEAEAVEAA